jgi:hypothetical protein
MFITGVNDIGNKLFTCHWYRNKFITGFVDTGEQLSPVTTTPAISCSPVATTPAIKLCHVFPVIASVVDTGNKFITGVTMPVTTTLAIYLLRWQGQGRHVDVGSCQG